MLFVMLNQLIKAINEIIEQREKKRKRKEDKNIFQFKLDSSTDLTHKYIDLT